MLDLINRYARFKAERGDECLSDLGLDALDKLSIALEIEETHGIEVRDAQIESWQYVGDICAMVERVG